MQGVLHRHEHKRFSLSEVSGRTERPRPLSGGDFLNYYSHVLYDPPPLIGVQVGLQFVGTCLNE